MGKLTSEEMAKVQEAVDGKVMSMAVVRLYTVREDKWVYIFWGVLCLCEEADATSYFRMVQLVSFKMIWETMLFKKMKYKRNPAKPFVHAFFNPDGVLFSFSFSEISEANTTYTIASRLLSGPNTPDLPPEEQPEAPASEAK